MSFVLFHTKQRGRPQILRSYSTRKGALIGMRASNRNAGYDIRYEVKTAANGTLVETARKVGVFATLRAPYGVMERELFDSTFPVGKITVKNLMSGKPVEIDADTPWCCNPASETFWSM
jgi:hypothetical protein